MSERNFGNLPFDPFAGRAEPTKRGEDTEEFLETEATDVTFSGQPVGGNEEPAEFFEEERADEGQPEEAPDSEGPVPNEKEAPAPAEEAAPAPAPDEAPASKTTKKGSKKSN